MPQPARGPKTFGAGGGHAKNAKYTLHRLGGYIWQYKYLFLLAIIVSLASNLFALVGYLIPKKWKEKARRNTKEGRRERLRQILNDY